MRADLALDHLADVTAAHDQRAARLHDGREDPAAHGAPHQQDQRQRCAEEDRRLDREEHLRAHHAAQDLAQDQEDQRAGQQRVKEIAELVEGRERDAAPLALVEVVDGEDRDPGGQREHGERDDQPQRRDQRRRCDRLGDPVGERDSSGERDAVDADEDPRAPAREVPAPLEGARGAVQLRGERDRHAAGARGLRRDLAGRDLRRGGAHLACTPAPFANSGGSTSTPMTLAPSPSSGSIKRAAASLRERTPSFWKAEAR